MKKQSKLGVNFAVCKVACGICATNEFKLPYRLGVALFNLEESLESGVTFDSISNKYKNVTLTEIEKLHTKVKEIIKAYEVRQDVS